MIEETMNCILEPKANNKGGMWLGKLTAAKDLGLLKQHKINSIQSMCPPMPLPQATYKANGIAQRVFVLDDDESCDIAKHFENSYNFIKRALAQGNQQVHCEQGRSRSTTVMIAYFMRENRTPYIDNYRFIKERRECICPNNGFIKQLHAQEKKLGLIGENIGKTQYDDEIPQWTN